MRFDTLQYLLDRLPERSQAASGKEPPHPPKVGDSAPDIELKNENGDLVSLKKLTREHAVVLVVLRGRILITSSRTTGACDGKPIDNNWVERLIKRVAVGRKNWLFIGSLRAGKHNANRTIAN